MDISLYYTKKGTLRFLNNLRNVNLRGLNDRPKSYLIKCGKLKTALQTKSIVTDDFTFDNLD